jgi:hypothetical protein
MAGKAKGIPRDTAITLRLSRELHGHLKEAAAGRSVSEEVRSRLERSVLEWSRLFDGTNDPKTRELTEAIAEVARNAAPYYGAWHENPYAFAVFKIAIDTLLSKLRPKGELVKPVGDDDEFRPGDTPEEAGATLARATIIARRL